MKKILSALLVVTVFTHCNNSDNRSPEKTVQDVTVAIATQAVNYSADSVKMNGFIAFDSASAKKRPAILVVHEWWGLNEYAKSRAKQLAGLGYVAMAVDMFGNGMQGTNPDEAGKLSMPFYINPKMAQQRFDAALQKLKTYPQVDTSKIAAIGYCFGGSMVLNMAALGEPLKAIVSFHGGLEGVVPLTTKPATRMLLCNGAADSFIKPAEIAAFRKNLDSVGADYKFINYDSAQHAFTNPEATAIGKKFSLPISYNAKADTASWTEMKTFLESVFK